MRLTGKQLLIITVLISLLLAYVVWDEYYTPLTGSRLERYWDLIEKHNSQKKTAPSENNVSQSGPNRDTTKQSNASSEPHNELKRMLERFELTEEVWEAVNMDDLEESKELLEKMNSGAAAFALAHVAVIQSEYEEKEKYYRQAVELDPNNSDYLSVLGVHLSKTGRHEEALGYAERSLAIELKTKAPDHSDVATRWANLGATLYYLGEHQKAIEYGEKALEIDLKNLGEEHPNIAIRWSNLGYYWRDLGEYEKAVDYFEKAAANNIDNFGSDNYRLGDRWEALGNAWMDLGKDGKARKYYEQAVSNGEKNLSDRSRVMARRLYLLGFSLHSLGEYRAAMRAYTRSRRIYSDILGKDHPDTKHVIELYRQAQLDRVPWLVPEPK